jgi:hypothetical protein
VADQDKPLFIRHEGELDPDLLPEVMAAGGFYLDTVTTRTDSLPEKAQKLLSEVGVLGCLEAEGNPWFIYRQKPAPEPLSEEEIQNL